MPKERTITVYQYSELSEKAKERARDWFCGEAYFEAQIIFSDMQADAKNIGLDLTEWDYGRYANGTFLLNPLECACKIIANHGEQCETYKTAVTYKTAMAKLDDNSEDYYEQAKELERDFLLGLLEDYRVMMDSAVDYSQSEEYISEMMEINEYEFNEDGKRI